jgi:predicted metalloprotease with PDZ domain
MKIATLAPVIAITLTVTAGSAVRAAAVPPLPDPVDTAWPGTLQLDVDASDVQRRIVHVTETLSGTGPGQILLLPRWVPGNHAPTGPLDQFAGLRISANGSPLAWSRDAVDTFAFHVQVPAPGTTLEIQFDFLSPLKDAVGPVAISPDLAILDWHPLVLYPAGYYARRIPVSGTLRLPTGWSFATALEPAVPAMPPTGPAPAVLQFRQVSLEKLIDSPVYAGRHAKRIDLDPGASVPVTLNLFADRPEQLAAKPEHIAAYRRLVQQARRLFASRHYDHYDFLFALSDQVDGKGVEHHQSSEDADAADMFTDWDSNAAARDLLPHEYTHSWNGKFRRPADLATPNYNVPMQNSLLWVYEGQTQYWGEVLSARSGLRTPEQALDQLAQTAAWSSVEAGRGWRSLQDTTSQPIINHDRPREWRSWTRAWDYYDEGALIWLDVDTLIRERTGGKRSLDDFARSFFGVHDGQSEVLTYTFEDVVSALDGVLHEDWASFLRSRLDSVGAPPPLAGLARGGYRLVYTDKPGDYQKNADAKAKVASFTYSIGLVIGNSDGKVAACAWGSPAFEAGITEAAEVLAVNGLAYDADVLREAIRAAADSHEPLELIVRTGSRFRVARIPYDGGLRYPHLERDGAHPALLDAILAPRSR